MTRSTFLDELSSPLRHQLNDLSVACAVYPYRLRRQRYWMNRRNERIDMVSVSFVEHPFPSALVSVTYR